MARERRARNNEIEPMNTIVAQFEGLIASRLKWLFFIFKDRRGKLRRY